MRPTLVSGAARRIGKAIVLEPTRRGHGAPAITGRVFGRDGSFGLGL